jgi:hypothetical protein
MILSQINIHGIKYTLNMLMIDTMRKQQKTEFDFCQTRFLRIRKYNFLF